MEIAAISYMSTYFYFTNIYLEFFLAFIGTLAPLQILIYTKKILILYVPHQVFGIWYAILIWLWVSDIR